MGCAVCGATIPHKNRSGRASKWDAIRAAESGWFEQKDGTLYCPEHVPDWVEPWRASRLAREGIN